MGGGKVVHHAVRVVGIQRLCQTIPQRSPRRPWADGVHQDVILGQFVGQGFAQTDDGRFRGVVVDQSGVGLFAEDRRNVDDPAPFLFLHQGNGKPGAANHAEQIDIKIILPLLI